MIAAPPQLAELPANAIVFVAQVPDADDATITKPEFRHRLRQVAAAKGRRTAPGPGSDDYDRMKKISMRELTEAAWIRGQAAEMGIGVTRREVKRELIRLRHEAFESQAQYRHFLNEAHFTKADVYERVETQLLTEKILARIVDGARSRAEEDRAIKVFVAEYDETWRARTTCDPEYAIPGRCSNASARPAPKRRH